MTYSEPVSARATVSPRPPRWMLPRVRVRQRGEVICVEQVVPARVAEVHTQTRGPGMTRRGRRTTRLYESGLGSPRNIPMVRERLTIPTGIVSTDQVSQAIEAALSGFQPTAYRTGPVRPSPSLIPHLIGAIATLAFAGVAIVMAMRIRMNLADSAAPDPMAWFLLAFPAVFVLVGVLMAAGFARRAWFLRTPGSIAEEQWGLLRQVLTTLSGQEPGSSRPLDVEAGMRRDLLTHPPGQFPQGGRIARATTADGRLGPPWPDAQDLRRLVRAGRRQALAIGVFLTVFLGLAGLIAAGVVLSLGLPVLPFACVGLGIAGAIMLQALKGADPVVLAYPRHLPGKRAPRKVRMNDVDVPSLPGWCAARRREDAWNAACATCAILFAGSIAGLLVGGMMSASFLPQASPGTAGSGPAGLLSLALTVAVAGVVVVSAVLGARRVARHDAERRRQANRLQAQNSGIRG